MGLSGGMIEHLTRREKDILTLLGQNLSDREIAERLVLSLNSIKWYTRQVYGKLGVGNRREAVAKARELSLLDTVAELASGETAASGEAVSKKPTHNLPRQLSSFIGREKEIAQVVALVRAHPLVTLTGAGGVGKTRLAIEAAGRALADLPDGAWYVELAPISNPDLVPQAVASALGLHEESQRPLIETLASFLSKRELLLVLDNCEHVLAACAQLVETLLRKAPHLRVLTSSREALGISGEATFRLPSLAVPDADLDLSLPGLLKCESVQLFAERAQAVLPAFVIDEHNAAAVATICRRLDGIPLALELAAARLSLMTPEQLAGRLDHVFRLLTGGSRTALPRQQTLRAAIDWSYKLLSPQEQVLLNRLAVFAGGGALEGIEAVCAGEGVEAEQVLDLLSGLVNKSMVSAESRPPGEMRYRLLETVRQYAREKLFDSGEVERLRGRHLQYYVALCEEAEPQLHSAGRPEWFRRLKVEYENIREALEWACQDPALALAGLRIATAITHRFWENMGYRREAFHWLNAGLRAAGEDIPKLLKAKTYYSISRVTTYTPEETSPNRQCIALCREIGPQADQILCQALGRYDHPDYDTMLAHQREGVEIARRLGQAGIWQLGGNLLIYSVTLFTHPDGIYDDQALAAAEESLQIARLGDHWAVGGLWVKAMFQTLRGQFEPARQAYEQALDVLTEVDDYNGIFWTLGFLVSHHRLAGQYALAQRYARELFQYADAVADEWTYRFYVVEASTLFVSSLNAGYIKWDPQAGEKAVRLFSFGSKLAGEMGSWLGARERPGDLQEFERLCRKLEEQTVTRAWNEGQALSLEEGVQLALSVQVDGSLSVESS